MEGVYNAVQLIGYQTGTVALTGEIIVENENGLFRQGSGEVGKSLTIGRKMACHVGKIGWNLGDGRHFCGGHGKIKGQSHGQIHPFVI